MGIRLGSCMRSSTSLLLSTPSPPVNHIIEAVIHVRVPSQAVLNRMQLTLHTTRPTPHGASRLVQATSGWLVKTRCARSQHFRDARVYGHTTTTVHDNGCNPPFRPPVARTLTASSLSFRRCVRAIIMSLCFMSSCLYLSTLRSRNKV